MGISLGIGKMLLAEHRRRPLGGSLVALGVQDVLFGFDQFGRAAREFGVTLPPVVPRLSGKPDFASRGWLLDKTVYEALGFADAVSLDHSAYEGAEVVFDLNRPDLPPDLCGRFDVVLDSGTTEHVFHVPNALRNYHRLLKPGGRVIHVLPASNYLDHGFYMFSPTLFADFYAANGWEVNTLQLARHDPVRGGPHVMYDYAPGRLDPRGGALDAAAYAVLCVATKAPVATADVVPQQGAFRRTWEAAQAGGPTDRADRPQMPLLDHPLTRRLVGRLQRTPGLYYGLRRAYELTLYPFEVSRGRGKGVPLPVSGRY